MENTGKHDTIRSLIPYRYEVVDFGEASALFFYVPYKPFKSEAGVARIDSFYIASNLAYTLAKEYAKKLSSLGIPCSPNPAIDYKSAIRGGFGKNTLLYRKGMGSRFAIGAILLSERLSPLSNAEYVDMPCDGCGLCEKECPLGAIGERFDRSRCMREYMLRPEKASRDILEAFEDRVLGCDICQRVCPMNEDYEQPMPEEIRRLLEYGSFAKCLREGSLDAVAALFGKNYAIRNSLLSMLIIAAANAGDGRFFEIAKESLTSGSPRVRAAAEYALKKLKQE